MAVRCVLAAIAGTFLALLFVLPRVCTADGLCELTACQKDEELHLKLHGEYEFRPAGPWRVELAATLPEPITSSDEAAVSIRVTWAGDEWRWTATAGYVVVPAGGEYQLSLRGAFTRAPWSGSGTVFLEGEDIGVRGYVARRLGAHWRAAFSQEVAEMRAGGDYWRYEAEADLPGAIRRGYGLAIGGTSKQYDPGDQIKEMRSFYADFSWTYGLSAGWSLGGHLKVTETEEYNSDDNLSPIPAANSPRLDQTGADRAQAAGGVCGG